MSGIRVAALMDAYTVTGPAKNFLRFCSLARDRARGICEISLITVVRRAASDPDKNPFISAARAIPIPVHVIFEQRRFDRQVIAEIRASLEQMSPDIVQSHGVKAHMLARLSRPGRERWLAFHHGYTAEDWKMRLYNQLDRWTLPQADRVVTVCRPFADMLASRGVPRDRLRVLPNSIEERFDKTGDPAAILRQWNIPELQRVILAVGRLSAEKGHSDLIEAVRTLRERPFRLLLVGDGPERARLEQQVEAAGLKDRVHFAGHQRAIGPYYETATVFVLPSHSEGSPNVLLEAMIAGVPVVSCAVGGVPETAEDGVSALLVKPGDPAALAAAIAKLLDNPALARELSLKAQATVRTRHSPEKYHDQLVDIYTELAPEKKVAPV